MQNIIRSITQCFCDCQTTPNSPKILHIVIIFANSIYAALDSICHYGLYVLYFGVFVFGLLLSESFIKIHATHKIWVINGWQVMNHKWNWSEFSDNFCLGLFDTLTLLLLFYCNWSCNFTHCLPHSFFQSLFIPWMRDIHCLHFIKFF